MGRYAGFTGWRRREKQQLAVLSLALATGACVSAFRLIDALLFRTEASPYPLSSRPKWRDLRFHQPAPDPDGSSALPFVIPPVPNGRGQTGCSPHI
jgi:hypothetical protein